MGGDLCIIYSSFFLLPSIDLPTSTEALEERRREDGWKIRQRERRWKRKEKEKK